MFVFISILQVEARTIQWKMQGIWEIVPTHMPDKIPGHLVVYKNAHITGAPKWKKNEEGKKLQEL